MPVVSSTGCSRTWGIEGNKKVEELAQGGVQEVRAQLLALAKRRRRTKQAWHGKRALAYCPEPSPPLSTRTATPLPATLSIKPPSEYATTLSSPSDSSIQACASVAFSFDRVTRTYSNFGTATYGAVACGESPSNGAAVYKLVQGLERHGAGAKGGWGGTLLPSSFCVVDTKVLTESPTS